jgi:predicted acylesterase/phospholipase RssA
MEREKRALILSSGGLKACWQVGVIKALSQAGTQWDVVCGCSAGAVNAGILAMYDVGNEDKAVSHLEAMWKSYSKATKRPSCIYAKGLFNVLGGGYSIQDDSMLYSLCEPIRTDYLRKSTRNLFVLANSLSSGGHVFGSEYPQIKTAIIASMSVPGLFPPQQLKIRKNQKEWFVDGAMSTSLPHFVAGMDVDVVLANTTDTDNPCNAEPTTIDVAPPSIAMTMMRSFDTEMEQTLQRSIKTLKNNNNTVRIFQPPPDLKRKNFYQMSHDDVVSEIKMSFEITKEKLAVLNRD